MSYIITSHGLGLFDVYNEDSDTRYSVDIRPKYYSCSCPHWYYRLRKSRSICKHIEMARKEGGWNDHYPR